MTKKILTALAAVALSLSIAAPAAAATPRKTIGCPVREVPNVVGFELPTAVQVLNLYGFNKVTVNSTNLRFRLRVTGQHPAADTYYNVCLPVSLDVVIIP